VAGAEALHIHLTCKQQLKWHKLGRPGRTYPQITLWP
jgi:hypothetical protein